MTPTETLRALLANNSATRGIRVLIHGPAGSDKAEIKDALCKYANEEVAYLMQRIEHYHGIVVLATRHRPSIDTSLRRRAARWPSARHPRAGIPNTPVSSSRSPETKNCTRLLLSETCNPR